MATISPRDRAQFRRGLVRLDGGDVPVVMRLDRLE
jgi:hypothetical protein